MLFFIVLLAFVSGCTNITEISQAQVVSDGVDGMANIKWINHASFKITGEKTIYIDPWKVERGDKADIILVTHPHYDHCSAEDIMGLSGSETYLVATSDCQSKIDSFPGKVIVVEQDKEYDISGIKVETVPAYNINKEYHPKKNGWVGYIITINGERIYHAGDSDATPEMEALKDIDIALLPIGGTYTMTAEEAAEAANAFMPKKLIPMHWGDIIGSRADAEKVKRLCNCKVEILN